MVVYMVVGRKITFKDEDELKEFQRMAKEFGMTLSSFVRYSMRFTTIDVSKY